VPKTGRMMPKMMSIQALMRAQLPRYRSQPALERRGEPA